MIDNDKLLLEKAAKAAEITWIRDYKDGPMKVMMPFTHEWNPLTDEGDALRLAVKLKMEVYHGDDEGEAVYASYVKPNSAIAYCVEYYDNLSNKGNPCAATCRAIVRAAAKIGESMV